MHHKNLSLRFFLAGTVIAGLLAIIGLVFLDREQCPANYTQAQVDAAGCVVGANIGFGLTLFLAAAVLVCSGVIALVMLFLKRKQP